MAAARVVRNKIDSIYSKNGFSYVLVSGDFNDSRSDKSIEAGLGAIRTEELTASRNKYGGKFCVNCLINLYSPNAEGTHKFQGEWEFLDQAMVSEALSDHYTIQYNVLQNEFLLKKSEKTGESSPYRTYLGPFYKGGISDHLPIVVSFKKRDRHQPEK